MQYSSTMMKARHPSCAQLLSTGCRAVFGRGGGSRDLPPVSARISSSLIWDLGLLIQVCLADGPNCGIDGRVLSFHGVRGGGQPRPDGRRFRISPVLQEKLSWQIAGLRVSKDGPFGMMRAVRLVCAGCSGAITAGSIEYVRQRYCLRSGGRARRADLHCARDGVA